MTFADRVAFRVKVWPEGQAEPSAWQADAYDNSASRATAGAVGLRVWGAGTKHFDDLGVAPLGTPVAAFSAAPLSGSAPLTVTFSNSSTNASDYGWNFGDSITSTVISPTHVYTQNGVYTVTLVASNGLLTNTLTRTNYITVAPAGVVANFSAFPLSGPLPLLVQFLNDSTGASSYAWSFGDGITATLPSPTHTYTASGVYTVTLAASNGTLTHSLTRTHYLTVTGPITRNWQFITTTVAPPIVGEQAMAYDSARNRVVLYGGNGTGWPYADTTWEFDGSDWLTITTSVSPTARYGAAMAYDNVRGEMILFGGSNADDLALNQTWRYTNTQWSQVTITGAVPASRTYASMAPAPNGQLYLFGGNNGAQVYFDDLWRYENGSWTEISVSGARPSARTDDRHLQYPKLAGRSSGCPEQSCDLYL
jgi:PKD repeat protein